MGARMWKIVGRDREVAGRQLVERREYVDAVSERLRRQILDLDVLPVCRLGQAREEQQAECEPGHAGLRRPKAFRGRGHPRLTASPPGALSANHTDILNGPAPTRGCSRACAKARSRP